MMLNIFCVALIRIQTGSLDNFLRYQELWIVLSVTSNPSDITMAQNMPNRLHAQSFLAFRRLFFKDEEITFIPFIKSTKKLNKFSNFLKVSFIDDAYSCDWTYECKCCCEKNGQVSRRYDIL